MKRFLILLPLLFIIMWLALIFESTAFALLGFSAVAFAVLSFLWLTFTVRRISLQLRIPAKVADRGQTVNLLTVVQNDYFFPVSKVKVYITYGESHEISKDKHMLKIYDVPVGKSETMEPLVLQKSGYFEFKISKIQVYDPFGIFYITRKRKGAGFVMVLPKLQEIPIKLGESVKHFSGEATDYDETHPGKDVSEIFGFREFHDGDRLQRIHWKLSARMDELMVKEDSLPKACAILLFMPESSLNNSDALDYAASVSFSLMDAKCPHFIIWQSKGKGDMSRARVFDEESFYEAITIYMQDVSMKMVDDCVARYKEKYKGEQFLHSICVFTNGTVTLDGEPVSDVNNMTGELFLK